MSSRDPNESVLGEAEESLMAELADDYCDRLEKGEQPDVEDYARRHPKIAGALRQVLPALKALRLSGDSPLGGLSGVLAGESTKVTGRLGDFDIVREIGRGGMGIVYEAEQISLNRRVALKILPFAAALDPTRLDRFRYEAQAAARLHHSNIVPVYSVGCERGVYYYAMQYIEGQSLARAVRQWRQAGDAGMAGLELSRSGAGGTVTDDDSDDDFPPYRDPGDRLSMQEPAAGAGPAAGESSSKPRTAGRREPVGTRDTRMEATVTTMASTGGRRHIETVVNLAIQAAEALEAAHQMGIVHRDVKPANLLVDMRGHLWVTDFGLARFKTDADLTATGNLVGTLKYMSPEQAVSGSGSVDHRTDIYSLAATVYELLTFEPVITAESQPEMLVQLQQRDPRPVRKLNPAVPADLETIVLKGLAKEPRDRYASAGEMAADFRRFLQHEPIRAKRPTVVERMVKWSRRHRSLVVSGVVLLVLAVAGLSASLTLLAREQARTAEAHELLKIEHVNLEDKHADLEAALLSEELALQAKGKALQAAELQRLAAQQNFQQAHDMLDFFMEIGEEEMADEPRLAELRTRMFQAGLEYYQQFIEQHENDPQARAELANSHFHLARILHETDRTAAAAAAMEDAGRYHEQLVRDFPEERSYRWRLMRIYRELGILQGRDRLNILEQPWVQEQLKVTDAQRQSVSEYVARENEFYEQVRSSPDPSAMRSEMQDHGVAAAQAIEQLLDAAQVTRFNQICLQARGMRALSDPEIVAALDLTEAQQQDIRALQQQLRRWRRDRSRGDGDGRRSSGQEIAELPRLEEMLTPTQLAKWDELKGDDVTDNLWRSWRRPRGSREGREQSRESERPQRGARSQELRVRSQEPDKTEQ